MSIEKIVVVDRIEILEAGNLHVRQATKIIENGKEISRSYHRHVLNPGDSLNSQDAKVIAIANAVWTDEVISSYQAQQESIQAGQ